MRALRRIRVASLALVLALGAAPSHAPAQGGGERLERLREEIEAREQRARSFREEAEGHVAELEGVDRELAELRRSMRRLREREKTAEEERKVAERALAEAETALTKIEKALESRLVALYKFGRAGGISALYTAMDFQSVVQRGEALTRILAEDQRLFAEHREARQRWTAGRDQGLALEAEIRDAQGEVGRRETSMRRKLVERRNLVDLLRSRSDREQRAAQELREAAGRLEEALAKLPRSGAKPAGKGLVQGGLGWPLDGTLRLGFGRQVDPEFGTETLRNGVELEAPAGSPVRAVATGRVLFSGWFRGYGQVVILDHGSEDITVSGFLEELRVDAGDRVRDGEVIGTVGETGSISGPGLYFEIRHGGKPVDPARWLSSRATEGTP